MAHSNNTGYVDAGDETLSDFCNDEDNSPCVLPCHAELALAQRITEERLHKYLWPIVNETEYRECSLLHVFVEPNLYHGAMFNSQSTLYTTEPIELSPLLYVDVLLTINYSGNRLQCYKEFQNTRVNYDDIYTLAIEFTEPPKPDLSRLNTPTIKYNLPSGGEDISDVVFTCMLDNKSSGYILGGNYYTKENIQNGVKVTTEMYSSVGFKNQNSEILKDENENGNKYCTFTIYSVGNGVYENSNMLVVTITYDSEMKPTVTTSVVESKQEQQNSAFKISILGLRCKIDSQWCQVNNTPDGVFVTLDGIVQPEQEIWTPKKNWVYPSSSSSDSSGSGYLDEYKRPDKKPYQFPIYNENNRLWNFPIHTYRHVMYQMLLQLAIPVNIPKFSTNFTVYETATKTKYNQVSPLTIYRLACGGPTFLLGDDQDVEE